MLSHLQALQDCGCFCGWENAAASAPLRHRARCDCILVHCMLMLHISPCHYQCHVRAAAVHVSAHRTTSMPYSVSYRLQVGW
jgi:hypothetical protein